MRTTNVTAAELQQAKALLWRQITMSESSEDAVAGGFVARALVGLPLDEPIRAAQRYDAVTADQVRAAFEKWIQPEALVQVVRGPPLSEPGRARIAIPLTPQDSPLNGVARRS